MLFWGVVWISCLLGTAECAACTEVIGSNDFPNVSGRDAGPISVVMAGDWLADCCGVITKWQFKSQSAVTDFIDLQVWYNTDVNAAEATMLGSIKKATPALQDVTIKITDPTEQLPIRMNYAIGWLSYSDEVIPYRDNCAGEVGCTGDYFWFDVGAAGKSTPYGPGLRSPFAGVGAYNWSDFREYAIRVFLDKGAVPTLDNLPAEATVERADGLNSGTIFTVAFNDANTFELSSGLVTVNLTSADPEKALECFSIDGTSGEVTVVKDLQVYLTCVDEVTLTIEVTDGCNDATVSTLVVKITDLKVQKSSSCADNGILSTTTGEVLVAIVVLCGVTCACAVVGIIIYFWKARQVTGTGSDSGRSRVEAEGGSNDQPQDTATLGDVSLQDIAQQSPSPPHEYESLAAPQGLDP